MRVKASLTAPRGDSEENKGEIVGWLALVSTDRIAYVARNGTIGVT